MLRPVMVPGTAGRRLFLGIAIIGGDARPEESPAEFGRRVLQNSVERAMVALLVWPAPAAQLTPRPRGVLPARAAGFVNARPAFRFGDHRSGQARASALRQRCIRARWRLSWLRASRPSVEENTACGLR
ncbi:hypothetical protein LNKW23_17690 [Paralimibaculum aggregatum]|uniref:Uncharacterized protein n=1 Tax=Paralimibaculum aggregatum TaxID=3036245 RepID=A0ABQ6LJI1_9RHOB|nr:hypothetical protein [Limibaculum sp. NKW23]GMG82556.1 hypothetical protein LNKW23_17690 [Limibaculum sp. NKW23]